MHVMIDEPEEVADRSIAEHIVAVHQLKLQALAAPYTMEDMQQYIKYARAIRPEMCDEVLSLASLRLPIIHLWPSVLPGSVLPGIICFARYDMCRMHCAKILLHLVLCYMMGNLLHLNSFMLAILSGSS